MKFVSKPYNLSLLSLAMFIHLGKVESSRLVNDFLRGVKIKTLWSTEESEQCDLSRISGIADVFR